MSELLLIKNAKQYKLPCYLSEDEDSPQSIFLNSQSMYRELLDLDTITRKHYFQEKYNEEKPLESALTDLDGKDEVETNSRGRSTASQKYKKKTIIHDYFGEVPDTKQVKKAKIKTSSLGRYLIDDIVQHHIYTHEIKYTKRLVL